MGGSAAADSDDSIDWNTEDELEVENYPGSGSREASSSAEGVGSSNSKLFDQFLGMGFTAELVAKVINEIGEENPDAILNHLLTYKELGNSPQEPGNSPQEPPPNTGSDQDSDPEFNLPSSDYEGSLDDFLDSNSDTEEVINPGVDQKKIQFLAEMGYTMDEALIAVERCGADAPANELADFIFAARFAKAEDVFFPEDKPKPWVPSDFSKLKKRSGSCYNDRERKLQRKDSLTNMDEPIQLPNPMVGFGVPSDPGLLTHRKLPDAAIGPPYFYYENVALAPKGVWDTISRFLYDVEPEFVDSKYFCAAARKRGYVHNLPINNRFPLLPLPPRTIHEAFPMTRKWWPAWDPRTKLNCLQTCIGSAKLTERIRKSLEGYDEEPPEHVQRYVLNECRKWNLVWVGKNKVAVLEADEVEMLLGFPKNHTRGISRTDRYKSLGNSFQVDTVAYHLSVLKDLFPGGINLLSLFSGIGGAEVALHRLGVRLKNVVSVEKSEVNQNVMKSWWEQTNQKGTLIHMDDVQQLNGDKLEQFIDAFGGFDLIVGGSPCNNLAGSNRHHRDGLEGKESSLFYDYFRILDLVKCMMSKGQ